MCAVMPDGIAYDLLRARLGDGQETTVYLVRHPLPGTRVRVMWFAEPTRLDVWCATHEHREAMVGGFFLRDPIAGWVSSASRASPVRHEPAARPRSCTEATCPTARTPTRTSPRSSPARW